MHTSCNIMHLLRSGALRWPDNQRSRPRNPVENKWLVILQSSSRGTGSAACHAHKRVDSRSAVCAIMHVPIDFNTSYALLRQLEGAPVTHRCDKRHKTTSRESPRAARLSGVEQRLSGGAGPPCARIAQPPRHHAQNNGAPGGRFRAALGTT